MANLAIIGHATPEEALEISAHYREFGYYYNINKNEFLKL